MFKTRAYALVLAGSVAYLASATLEQQDARSGSAIYRVYLPDRDLLISVSDVSTMTLYAKQGRKWTKLDSVFFAVPATAAGTALEARTVVGAVRYELADVTRTVYETARLVDAALGALPAILPLAMEFKKRAATPGWARILPFLLIAAVLAFVLLGGGILG